MFISATIENMDQIIKLTYSVYVDGMKHLIVHYRKLEIRLSLTWLYIKIKEGLLSKKCAVGPNKV